MRFVNRRTGWVAEGKYIGTIAAGVKPTADEVLAYYHLRPGDLRFSGLACAMRWTRIVLLKQNGNFLIAPITPDVSEITA